MPMSFTNPLVRNHYLPLPDSVTAFEFDAGT